MLKIFFPPLFTQAMAAKNITSPIAIFDPCTHGKKFFTPSTKKVVPMCGWRRIFSAPVSRVPGSEGAPHPDGQQSEDEGPGEEDYQGDHLGSLHVIHPVLLLLFLLSSLVLPPSTTCCTAKVEQLRKEWELSLPLVMPLLLLLLRLLCIARRRIGFFPRT